MPYYYTYLGHGHRRLLLLLLVLLHVHHHRLPDRRLAPKLPLLVNLLVAPQCHIPPHPPLLLAAPNPGDRPWSPAEEFRLLRRQHPQRLARVVEALRQQQLGRLVAQESVHPFLIYIKFGGSQTPNTVPSLSPSCKPATPTRSPPGHH